VTYESPHVSVLVSDTKKATTKVTRYDEMSYERNHQKDDQSSDTGHSSSSSKDKNKEKDPPQANGSQKVTKDLSSERSEQHETL